ncbi:Alpha/Beta hydrolase protein [Ganoderma leucocontextum]|nr:Alpha/Beta hydrolase protein [Ganoderma leucocontextum]
MGNHEWNPRRERQPQPRVRLPLSALNRPTIHLIRGRDRYFQAANPSSTQRHIYSVPLPTLKSTNRVEPSSLTDISSPGYYDASFSPQGAFYLLSYRGPHPPWQRVIHVGHADFNYVVSENPQLNDTLATYELPIVTHSDGHALNVLEMRPPRMDDSGRTKYPVLFRVYGGPGSQMVDVRFQHDWHDYVVSELQYIVVVVDGRGPTGFKGRKLRNPVKNNLGRWETRDQVNAAKVWAAKEYVDPKRKNLASNDKLNDPLQSILDRAIAKEETVFLIAQLASIVNKIPGSPTSIDGDWSYVYLRLSGTLNP